MLFIEDIPINPFLFSLSKMSYILEFETWDSFIILPIVEVPILIRDRYTLLSPGVRPSASRFRFSIRGVVCLFI